MTEAQQNTPFPWLAVVLLAGAYSFGINLHNIMHELGHSAAVLIQGGDVTGFFFHPFKACLNYSTYVPNHVLLYAGGFLIVGGATVVFPVLLWKIRSPYILPLVLACAAGLTTTARWLLIGAVAGAGCAFGSYASCLNNTRAVGLIIAPFIDSSLIRCGNHRPRPVAANPKWG